MIEGTTREGKKIAVGTCAEETVSAAGSVDHTVRIGELSIVEAVLQVNMKVTLPDGTTTAVQVSIPQNIDITEGNFITFTLYYSEVTTATKVTPEVVAIGF